MWRKTFEHKRVGYMVAVLGTAAVTAALKLFGWHVNSTTVALGLLLVVLFVATGWGARPAVLSSLLGVVCFNFFYLPPVGRFSIDATDNWVALFAFLVTAVTAGQLWSRARRRAEEAESGRREIERLYSELRDAFERASHAEALRRSERLKSALLDAVTHDLRTPLTSIKASVSTLLEDFRSRVNVRESVALDEEGRGEMLEVIDEETDRLNHFVEGLVEMARIEAGEMRLRRRWGSLEEIVAAALDWAKKHYHDVLIVDTAGRLAIDDAMMAEIKALHARLAHARARGSGRARRAAPVRARGRARRRRSSLHAGGQRRQVLARGVEHQSRGGARRRARGVFERRGRRAGRALGAARASL